METYYSIDDEDYRSSFGEMLDSLEEKPNPGDTYFECDSRRVLASDAVDVDTVIDDMDTRLYDVLGECYEGEELGVSKEAKEELEALLYAWFDKHTNVGRFYIFDGKSRQKQFTVEDLEDL